MAVPKGLFPSSLISPECLSSFPDGYVIRPLEREDYGKGFLDCLRVLTHVGDVTEEKFAEHFDWMKSQGQGVHYIVVIENNDRIVGTGALMIERKFIHDLGTIGHIEEIAIAKDQQGKKLGLKLIQTLSAIAKSVGCYKSTLGTSDKNAPFYVKCGYELKGNVMSQYYEEAKSGYERG